jgi:hypothetical protein
MRWRVAQRKAKRRIARRRGAGWWLVPLLFVAAVGGAVALMAWPDTVDRLVHPDRYRVSGTAMVAADRYVAAADAVLARGETIARIEAPRGDGPVLALASGEATVFLDPPSARVLGVARGGGWYDGAVRWLRWRRRDDAGPPLATPALTVDRVLALAGKLDAARWVSVEWPTERRADWVVAYRRGRVKVADDAGGSVVVRARE